MDSKESINVNDSKVSISNQELDNNFVCSKCGKKLEKDWGFCPFCSKSIKNNYEMIFVIIIIISFCLGYYFENIFYMIASGVFVILGLIFCPNSRAISMLFWIILVLFFLYENGIKEILEV